MMIEPVFKGLARAKEVPRSNGQHVAFVKVGLGVGMSVGGRTRAWRRGDADVLLFFFDGKKVRVAASSVSDFFFAEECPCAQIMD
jgi:hypothetical protein